MNDLPSHGPLGRACRAFSRADALIRSSTWCTLCGLALVKCASPAPAPRQLSIATYNVHNLIAPSASAPPQEAAAYEEQVARVSSVVDQMGADVVVLQEIGGVPTLTALASRASRGSPYRYLAFSEGNDPRGIHIAALSREPIAEQVNHRDDVLRIGAVGGSEATVHYARDCLELHFDIGSHRLVLLAVHFKSKASPDWPEKRLAEASHTRFIADQLTALEPGLEIAILGDFNDVPGSPPWEAVSGTTVRFRDVAEAMTADQAWTYNYRGGHELIDHEMLNPLLQRALVEAHVWRTPSSEGASDHAPLLALFEFR